MTEGKRGFEPAARRAITCFWSTHAPSLSHNDTNNIASLAPSHYRAENTSLPQHIFPDFDTRMHFFPFRNGQYDLLEIVLIRNVIILQRIGNVIS